MNFKHTNQIHKSGYTHELLMELTDEQLDEHEAYWREVEAHHRSHPPKDPVTPGNTSMYATHGFNAYKSGQQVGHVRRERERRAAL